MSSAMQSIPVTTSSLASALVSKDLRSTSEISKQSKKRGWGGAQSPDENYKHREKLPQRLRSKEILHPALCTVVALVSFVTKSQELPKRSATILHTEKSLGRQSHSAQFSGPSEPSSHKDSEEIFRPQTVSPWSPPVTWTVCPIFTTL